MVTPAEDSSCAHPCGSCAQVEEELLCLVTELQEEVSSLRRIRESEMEMDPWDNILPPLDRPSRVIRGII